MGLAELYACLRLGVHDGHQDCKQTTHHGHAADEDANHPADQADFQLRQTLRQVLRGGELGLVGQVGGHHLCLRLGHARGLQIVVGRAVDHFHVDPRQTTRQPL